jgi:hypothetical protein
MKGIIYILINEAMPGYIKIGKTTNTVEQRMKELYKTSVPLPFECFFAGVVEDINKVEKALHDAFADNRVSSNREFFEIAPERVFAVLELLSIENATPNQDYIETEDDKKALDKAKEIRSRFNFKMVDIPKGSILNFSRDNDIICEVIDDNKVLYGDKEMSLSESAREILISKGYNWRTVQGPRYWSYQGETLDERRKRMEEGN